MRLKFSNWILSFLVVIIFVLFFYVNFIELEDYEQKVNKNYTSLIVSTIENNLNNIVTKQKSISDNKPIQLSSSTKHLLSDEIKYLSNIQEIQYIILQTKNDYVQLVPDSKLSIPKIPQISNDDFIEIYSKKIPELFKFTNGNNELYEIRSALNFNLNEPVILRIGVNFNQISEEFKRYVVNTTLLTIFILLIIILFINYQDIISEKNIPLYHNQQIIDIFTKISQNLLNGIIFIDPQKKIRILNNAAEKITGVNSKTAIMNDYLKVFPNDLFNVEEVLGNNKSQELTHTILYTEDGRKLEIFYSTSIININQVLNGILISIQDYTTFQRKINIKMNKKIVESNAKLATGISKLILNKINDIYLSFQSLIKKKNIGTSDLTKYDQIVLSAILDIEDLIREFQNFSRLPKIDYSLVNIDDVIEDIIKSGKKISSGKKINFRKNYQPFISFYTDFKLFAEMMNILITNSIEAIENEGDIIISATLSLNTITITITDSGCGIPKSVQDNLYNPFNTTKQNHLGFGLAKVNKYVTLMGGDLSYQTNENIGTTITMVLPTKIEKHLHQDELN